MDATTERTKLTAKDLWRLTCEDSKWERYELDDGELIEMPPAGPRHGTVEFKLGHFLGMYLDEHPLGEAMSGDVGFELSSGRVRAPDIAFLSHERLASTPIPEQGFYPGPPDLAIEVRSPDDSVPEILRKLSRFLEAGTRLAWVVDPKKKTVTVYHPDGEVEVLKEGDTLSGEPVLPGFSLPLARLFAPRR
jgi:Uma2 family endonuclease